jgi:hypothetical protein
MKTALSRLGFMSNREKLTIACWATIIDQSRIVSSSLLIWLERKGQKKPTKRVEKRLLSTIAHLRASLDIAESMIR